MTERPQLPKLRRFFTSQPLGDPPADLWLEVAETRHLRYSIRLKAGDRCLVTDGEGRQAEAIVREFTQDGRAHLHAVRSFCVLSSHDPRVCLRVIPAMLRKGKTDLLVEKAQELGVFEFWPIVTEYCEIKVRGEKAEKMVGRWNRISREASKQSGALRVVHVTAPRNFKEAIADVPGDERIVIFHPCPEALSFPQWVTSLRETPEKPGALNLFFGPEGGFSAAEIDWVKWERKEDRFSLVSLGDVLLKADTAFVGVVAALRFSGVL